MRSPIDELATAKVMSEMAARRPAVALSPRPKSENRLAGRSHAAIGWLGGVASSYSSQGVGMRPSCAAATRPGPAYSMRNAVTGSMRVARRAGM